MRLARIACLDLDTFFVSVERILDPSLAGKAVVVGGTKGGRGVVTSASYEARAFGVRSGISIREATELAPHAVFLPGHHEHYGDYSRRAREIVERFSPVVIAASIDEQYIDFHGCESLYREPGDVDDDATILRTVRTMTKTIADELGLPSSAGIATSKSTAKVACGLAKPAGVILVAAGAEEATLAPLPVRKLPGIGPVSEEKLQRRGIRTLGDLVRAPDDVLRPIFGAYTSSLRRDALGQGHADLGRERPAFREHDPRGEHVGSISNERTFVERSREDTASVLCSLTERVCSRARSRGVLAGRVTLRLRYADFHTITRSRTIAPTNADVEVHEVVLSLYRKARVGRGAVRLLGVALSSLSLDGPQLRLPALASADRRGRTVDAVREKFGYDAVHLATTIERKVR
ncbi:MAG: DNA polymerase IV [Deltaproteobacteria bacterium]|nr:DNA polymerase IV [Deltaproteobacteria bacterium]